MAKDFKYDSQKNDCADCFFCKIKEKIIFCKENHWINDKGEKIVYLWGLNKFLKNGKTYRRYGHKCISFKSMIEEKDNQSGDAVAFSPQNKSL